MPGDYRMFPTTANGQPAAIAYRRASADTDAPHRAFGVTVLRTHAARITGIIVFADPALVGAFAFPSLLPAVN